MTPALNHYNRLLSTEVRGRYAILSDDCKNHFYADQLATIPKGTVLKIDFGCDSGLYGVADVNGVTHRIKIEVSEYHKIHVVENR